jgi:hypothetical protein
MGGMSQLLGEPAPRLRDIDLIGRHHFSVEIFVLIVARQKSCKRLLILGPDGAPDEDVSIISIAW